ncbi:MAG TPA: TIGR03086 family metal-binding protein [Mycobacteriales bacterium]|nr:TIGR03086 family metal-binding protein [Mycobacteriales bacterium]
MSEISERYARLVDEFAAVIDATPPDRWEEPSPCAGWTARDVVRHVVDTQGMFLGFVGRSLGEIPPVDEDPAGAFRAATTAVQADLEDPERAAAEFDGSNGRLRFDDAVGNFLGFDLIVHRWDLARAVGGDESIDPQEIEWANVAIEGFGDQMRESGHFGTASDPGPDASLQQRMLAALGRTA